MREKIDSFPPCSTQQQQQASIDHRCYNSPAKRVSTVTVFLHLKYVVVQQLTTSTQVGADVPADFSRRNVAKRSLELQFISDGSSVDENKPCFRHSLR